MIEPETFEIHDVTEWAVGGEEQLGTKRKEWLVEPSDPPRQWLWKETTFNEVDGSMFRKGDDWAERITTEVGRQLQTTVARTDLAVRAGQPGTVSLSVIDRENESLILGNTLLADHAFTTGRPRDRTGYTLQNVRTVLRDVDGSATGHSAFECLTAYLVMDAIVGNTDRHQENWAVIENNTTGERRLAPSFDHASSLGFQLSDTEKDMRITSADKNQRIDAWASRAASKFENAVHPVDVAAEALRMIDARPRNAILHRVADLDLANVIDPVPDHRMSGTARRFARQVMHVNRNRIVSLQFPTLLT